MDVSLEYSSICVVDANGKIIREAKLAKQTVATEAFDFAAAAV
jgi:hypothetical protein